jgi:acyl carrier protein
MTVEPARGELAEQDVSAELGRMLLEVTGEDERWAARVSASSRLEGDLRLDSIELAALGALLTSRYGDRVDIRAFLAELDIDQLIGLTVGDLAAQVVAVLRPVTARAGANAAGANAAGANAAGALGVGAHGVGANE